MNHNETMVITVLNGGVTVPTMVASCYIITFIRTVTVIIYSRKNFLDRGDERHSSNTFPPLYHPSQPYKSKPFTVGNQPRKPRSLQRGLTVKHSNSIRSIQLYGSILPSTILNHTSVCSSSSIVCIQSKSSTQSIRSKKLLCLS